jgi:predicted nucleic acid-binding protein
LTLYFDTSALAPLILEESTSSSVERFMAGLPEGELSISHWTRVEFSSLLAREVRMGGLERQVAEDADAQFETMVAESFVVFLPNADDFTLAKAYLHNTLAKAYLHNHETGLRAGDALHLAIASNRRAEAIYSFDTTLLKAGALLGLPVSGEMGSEGG